MIIIMADGSSKGNPGESSYALVIWERFKKSNPRMVNPTKKIYRPIGIATNNEAEWAAVNAAVRYGIERGMNKEDIYIPYYSNGSIRYLSVFTDKNANQSNLRNTQIFILAGSNQESISEKRLRILMNLLRRKKPR